MISILQFGLDQLRMNLYIHLQQYNKSPPTSHFSYHITPTPFFLPLPLSSLLVILFFSRLSLVTGPVHSHASTFKAPLHQKKEGKCTFEVEEFKLGAAHGFPSMGSQLVRDSFQKPSRTNCQGFPRVGFIER